MSDFYVINYDGERIPVVPNEDLTFRSLDGRDWSIVDGCICLNGVPLTPEEVTIGRPGPQDDLKKENKRRRIKWQQKEGLRK